MGFTSIKNSDLLCHPAMIFLSSRFLFVKQEIVIFCQKISWFEVEKQKGFMPCSIRRSTRKIGYRKKTRKVRRMQRYLFVTGKLAAPSLRDTVSRMSPGIEYAIAILPISVAALMDCRFIARHLDSAKGCTDVIVPGLCQGDLTPIMKKVGVDVKRGPRHMKDIPSYFGQKPLPGGYGAHQLQILSEIVDAFELSIEEVVARASYFRNSGADIIDLGCPVEGNFPDIENVVRTLKSGGYRVSVDTFHPDDILKADRAGVDYLLSVNSQNLELARRLKCKMVVIPDFDQGLDSLERNIAQMESWGLPYIIDPVLKPIGFGFAESIQGFISTRRKYPKAEMLMGVGNLTELTDADSTGITAVMAGIIAELGINYALTTERVSWARGAVRELDLARRLMHYACRNHILPKHLHDGLITIKDPPFNTYTEEELRAMQANVRDRNFRIFSDQESIYVFNNRLFIKDMDIQAIFNQLGPLEAAEGFYLGKELQKALLAVHLGKRYVQEEDLRWGYLSG
jgi:dihydropteroate synthase